MKSRLQVQAVLILGKESPASTEYGSGQCHDWSGCGGKNKNPCPCQELGPGNAACIACHCTDWATPAVPYMSLHERHSFPPYLCCYVMYPTYSHGMIFNLEKLCQNYVKYLPSKKFIFLQL